MSTPLTDRITGLTAQANAVTGASDTTLTDAVGTLISGYGGSFRLISSEVLTETYTDANATAQVWLDRYRLADSVLEGHVYLLEFLNNYDNGNYARYIFYTPPTVGKTSIHAICVRMRYHINDDLTTWCNARARTIINAYKIL